VHIPTDTYRLDNGLRVTLSQDRTAPIVAVNLWYHVGSGNEREGRTGFAHLFEHMLFQGSEHVGVNQHFELVQRAGGTLNGSTWLDRTNYFETVPSHYLDLALWLEADRMGYLLPAMTQEKLDTQRDVVKNERRWTVDNRPYGTWWEKLPALTFPSSHPFHHSLIGSMEDLDAASLDDIASFFRTYYTPDNAVLTVAGDFDVTSVREMIDRRFGAIPRGGGKPPLASVALPDTFGGWHREVVPDNVPLPRLLLAFRIPPFGSREWYAASVCTAVLGLRRGSRLYRSLVRNKEIASDATAFTYDLTKGSDLLVVDVTALPGIDDATLEREVVAEIDTLIADGARKEELARSIAMIETDFIVAMQTAQERADRLSMFATYFDDPARINTELDRYRAVTVDEVTAFARRSLVPTNRASLLYTPRTATA
jgi:predicted Zn-dependent peptidase